MMLLIDAGNTRAKYTWLNGSQRQTAACLLDYATLPAWPRQQARRPLRILGSNVAGPDVARQLDAACQAAWGARIQWCTAQHGQALLRNHYADPARLGADRWLGLLGLLQHLRGTAPWQAGHPAILASFGTATTIDTLLPAAGGDTDERPAFMGGLILPGPSLMAHSLTQSTAHLPLPQGRCVDFPRETHDAITSGIAAAQAGALLRQWRLAREAAQGRAPLVCATGGGWPLVREAIQAEQALARQHEGLPAEPIQFLDAPVLDGLAVLAGLPADAT